MDERYKELGYHGLFSDRESIQEAYNYAMNVADCLCESDRVAAMTAIQVLHNTWVKCYVQGNI